MIVAGWIYWAIYQVVSLALTIIGVPVIAVLCALKFWGKRMGRSPHYSGREVWAFRGGFLTAVFNNEEDGICGGLPPTRWGSFVWSSLRNSANNMRLLPGAFLLVDGATLKVRKTAHGYVATQGWRQCRQWRGFRFGWLIKQDAGTGWYAWPVLSRL